MPFCRHFFRPAMLGVAAWLLGATAPGLAEGERIYADSFGNLVIHSPAGFKRILVGRGYLAGEFARRGTPKRVYLEERQDGLYLRERPCRHGSRLHGRSYMYGLPENVVPVPVASC